MVSQLDRTYAYKECNILGLVDEMRTNIENMQVESMPMGCVRVCVVCMFVWMPVQNFMYICDGSGQQFPVYNFTDRPYTRIKNTQNIL